MGRHTKGRRKRTESGGPSIYFFIALAIGIALLIWTAVTVISRPAEAPPARATSQGVDRPVLRPV